MVEKYYSVLFLSPALLSALSPASILDQGGQGAFSGVSTWLGAKGAGPGAWPRVCASSGLDPSPVQEDEQPSLQGAVEGGMEPSARHTIGPGQSHACVPNLLLPIPHPSPLPFPLSSVAGLSKPESERTHSQEQFPRSGAADSALLPGGSSVGGWLPWAPALCSPGPVPWECCLGQGHVECTATWSVDLAVFPAVRVVHLLSFGPLRPLNRPGRLPAGSGRGSTPG